MTPELRERLGQMVRKVWVEWAKEQSDPKPSWLVEWEELSESDKEVDRRIGESVWDFATAQERIECLKIASEVSKDFYAIGQQSNMTQENKAFWMGGVCGADEVEVKIVKRGQK